MQCETCRGTGEGALVWTGGSEPQPDYTAPCSDCDGTGNAPQETVEAKPEQQPTTQGMKCCQVVAVANI